MREISAQPLSFDAFAPYGSVVSAGLRAGRAANQGTAMRFDFCAPLISTRPHARANVAVFRSSKARLPFEVRLLEKHPCSTQTFLPMICVRFLVVVAPSRDDGTPNDERLAAFICGPGQGVSYGVGTWHHPIIALDGDADFSMIAFEDGSPRDCVEQRLPSSVFVAEAR